MAEWFSTTFYGFDSSSIDQDRRRFWYPQLSAHDLSPEFAFGNFVGAMAYIFAPLPVTWLVSLAL